MFRVIHFEISANDPDQVIAFYQKVFGWKISKWEGPEPYWMVSTAEEGAGIDGGIFRPREEFNDTVNTIEVPDIEAFMEKIVENGGEVVTEKMPIPGVGYQVYCKDVEGTLFGIHQSDPSAGQ